MQIKMMVSLEMLRFYKSYVIPFQKRCNKLTQFGCLEMAWLL